MEEEPNVTGYGIDNEQFDSFVRALCKASEKLEKKKAALQLEEKKKEELSGSTKEKILSTMKKMDDVFSDNKKKKEFVKQEIYELCCGEKKDQKKIDKSLMRIENMVHDYVSGKTEREDKIKALEAKIRKKTASIAFRHHAPPLKKSAADIKILKVEIRMLKRRCLSLKGRPGISKEELSRIKKKITVLENRIKIKTGSKL